MITQEEILEGNKLIAEFLEWKTTFRPQSKENYYTACFEHPSGNWDTMITVGEGFTCKNKEEAELYLWEHLCHPEYGRCGTYHKDWNRLMPVIEKIESLGYDTRIRTHLPVKHLCSVNDEHGNPDICEVSSSKIEAVWLAVVKFIKWYNDQNKLQ